MAPPPPTSRANRPGPSLGISRAFPRLNLAAYVCNTLVTYASQTGVFGATNSELSRKYQTLVTPAGWAFSIWGPIFIWEGAFVVAQLLPRFRGSQVLPRVSPFWWAVCVFQVVWTLAFAQELITLALISMLCILISLLGISWSTDGLRASVAEYFLLRAPFSLHLGWIIAASVVNVSVQADAARASQGTLLALAIVSYAVVLAAVTGLTFAVQSPDPFVGVVAAWACTGIASALGDPTDLNNTGRFNPSGWDTVTLEGLRGAALVVGVLAFGLAAEAALRPFCWASAAKGGADGGDEGHSEEDSEE